MRDKEIPSPPDHTAPEAGIEGQGVQPDLEISGQVRSDTPAAASDAEWPAASSDPVAPDVAWFRDLTRMSAAPEAQKAGTQDPELVKTETSEDMNRVADPGDDQVGVPASSPKPPFLARLTSLFEGRKSDLSGPLEAELTPPDDTWNGTEPVQDHGAVNQEPDTASDQSGLRVFVSDDAKIENSDTDVLPTAGRRPLLPRFLGSRSIEVVPPRDAKTEGLSNFDRKEPDLIGASATLGSAGPAAGEVNTPPHPSDRSNGLFDRTDLVTGTAQREVPTPIKGKIKPADKARGYPPIQVIIGWIEESSSKDVLEHARGFASDHIESLETAWIAMAEFRGGTLFEIHEGGGGYAYLPELVEGINRDPDQILWLPSGMKLNRVVTLSIVEGRPFSMMLNEADSARVRSSGQLPVERTGRMKRLVPRGTPILVFGGTLFALGFTALAASTFLSSRIDQQPIPSLSYNADNLPHGQIVTLSDALREDRWVSRILYENGIWRAEFETFDELDLPEDTRASQEIIDEAVVRDAVVQQERERKIREMQAQ